MTVAGLLKSTNANPHPIHSYIEFGLFCAQTYF